MADLNRDMSPAQKRGYTRALMDMQELGARMALEGIRLGGDDAPIPRHRLMEHTGRALISTAEVLARTLT